MVEAEEVVKRLRDEVALQQGDAAAWGVDTYGDLPRNIRAMSDAASLIESLERERDEQIAGHAAARQNFHLMQVSANELRKRAEAAEAQVARLTETLEKISRMNTVLDDKTNTFTLAMAHIAAAKALNHTDGDA